MYENIKREKAICYGKLAYSEMMLQRLENEETEKHANDEAAVTDAAWYLGQYDQEHVNVALWWPDESVTIHCKMPNDIYDIFLRLDGSLDCPAFAKAIIVQPCLLNSDNSMHTFTIWLNEGSKFPPFREYEEQWTDAKSFFLSVSDEPFDFDSAKHQKVDQ